jgi:hypothetical protein
MILMLVLLLITVALDFTCKSSISLKRISCYFLRHHMTKVQSFTKSSIYPQLHEDFWRWSRRDTRSFPCETCFAKFELSSWFRMNPKSSWLNIKYCWRQTILNFQKLYSLLSIFVIAMAKEVALCNNISNSNSHLEAWRNWKKKTH